ncbi:p1/s1 nuclease [Histomonas meleagridis]|uniref:p1/s1 nuclease n=1 Tax=Histomonas meleagridis TaxID=135588 RepID=UPI00355A640D|nr:p1/s1 nuclease [Histomonas meleagridis]KAH0798127.1 p1/s1 nuclease [Histomonas meleagridis]
MATELYYRMIGDYARELTKKFLDLEPNEKYDRLSETGAWLSYIERPPYNTKNFNHWRYTRTPIIKDGVNATRHHDSDDLVSYGETFLTSVLQSSYMHNWPAILAFKSLLGMFSEVHSPMHTSELFSKQFPEGDGSGENFYVIFNNQNVSLKWFWETGCGRYTSLLPFTEEQWKAIDARVDYYKQNYDSSSVRKSSRDFNAIATESYKIAVDYVYAGLSPGDTLNQTYITKCQEITDERIAKSGFTIAYRVGSFKDPVFYESKISYPSKVSVSFSVSIGLFVFLLPIAFFMIYKYFTEKEKAE